MFYTYDYKYKTEEVNFYLKKIGGDVMSTYETIVVLFLILNFVIVLINNIKK